MNFNKRDLFFLLTAMAVVLGVIGEVWEHPDVLSEHLFTEIIAAMITVFLIDHLLRMDREREALPKRTAAYIDVNSFITKHITLWSDAYNASVPEDGPTDFMEFFQSRVMDRIWFHLDVDKEINTGPSSLTWTHRIEGTYIDIISQGDKILTRDQATLPSEVYSDIHMLTTHYFPVRLSRLMSYKKWVENNKMGQAFFYKGPVLLSICDFMPEDYLNAVRRVIEWTAAERKFLVKENQHVGYRLAVLPTVIARNRSSAVDESLAKVIIQNYQDELAAMRGTDRD